MTTPGHDPARPDEWPALLTVSEIAIMAQVSRMTIYRMVHAGELPTLRVGGSFRVPADAAREYIAIRRASGKLTE